MRTKLLLPILFILSAILSSCVKKDIEKKEKEPGKLSELVVPSDFDWKMSTNVSCNFTSEHTAKVYVSTAANEEAFASFYVGQDVEQVKLNVPTSLNTLYVRYETETGLSTVKELNITNNSVVYTVPADSKEYDTDPVSPMANIGLSRSQDYPVIFYPAASAGWGTLMFEDLWPSYGDYDFNDMVVNYKIQLYPNNKNMVKEMLLGIRVKAIGGTLPFDLHLLIKNIKAGEIDFCRKEHAANALEDADMVLLNPGNNVKESPVFRFNNIRTNPNAPKGYSHLNTDPAEGARLKEEQMLELTFYIELKNSVRQADLDFEAFDFFIAKPYSESTQELQEIHVGGYEPSEYGKDVYTQIKAESSNIGKSESFYYSNTKLIWAINIPQNIPHAYEKADFMNAFTHFKTWATSGGKEYKNWYENIEDYRNSDYLIKQN